MSTPTSLTFFTTIFLSSDWTFHTLHAFIISQKFICFRRWINYGEREREKFRCVWSIAVTYDRKCPVFPKRMEWIQLEFFHWIYFERLDRSRVVKPQRKIEIDRYNSAGHEKRRDGWIIFFPSISYLVFYSIR